MNAPVMLPPIIALPPERAAVDPSPCQGGGCDRSVVVERPETLRPHAARAAPRDAGAIPLLAVDPPAPAQRTQGGDFIPGEAVHSDAGSDDQTGAGRADRAADALLPASLSGTKAKTHGREFDPTGGGGAPLSAMPVPARADGATESSDDRSESRMTRQDRPLARVYGNRNGEGEAEPMPKNTQNKSAPPRGCGHPPRRGDQGVRDTTHDVRRNEVRSA